MSRLRLPRVHRSAARRLADLPLGDSPICCLATHRSATRLADLPLGDSPICCSTTAPRQARPQEGKGEKWDARSAGSQAPHDWDRLPLPLPKSYMPRAPCFTRHGGRAWGSPGERNRPSEITDLDTHMHRPSAQGGLACIAQAPKYRRTRDVLPWERGNRELSADPRWLSIPPLYPVHVYRLAETYTTDQLLAKRVSSKHGSAFKASGLW